MYQELEDNRTDVAGGLEESASSNGGCPQVQHAKALMRTDYCLDHDCFRSFTELCLRKDWANHLDDDLANALIHGYYACVSYVDALVGQVLAEVDYSNTIVVLWGDHGFSLGENGIWGKYKAQESNLRIPLLVAVPGMDAARRSETVQTIDV